MDPPSANEEIPQPKLKLEPEEPYEGEVVVEEETPTPIPVTSPPLPPPEPPTEQVAAVQFEDTIDAAIAAEKANQSAATSTNTKTSPVKEAQKAPPQAAQKESAPPSTTATTTAATTSASSTSINDANEEDILPLSPAERSTSFDELRSYEAKRRSIYLKKLKSSVLYWRAFRDTLSKSYQETERAEVIMNGALVANRQYAEFLAAAAEDRLDYGGRAILEQRKAKKFQTDRLKKYETLGSGSVLWNVAVKKEEENKKKMEKLEGINSTGVTSTKMVDAVSFDGLTQDSVLTSFIESHSLMAEKFHENNTFVKEMALDKMTALRKELESEVNVMSIMGDATVFELEKAEDDVQKAWCEFLS